MNHDPSVTSRELPEKISPNGSNTLDRYIRLFGCSVLLLLVVAYATGEEFPHTYPMVGYGILVLLVAALAWEIIKLRVGSHGPHSSGPTGSAERHDRQTAAVSLLITLPILALLSVIALTLMLVTHNYWGATLVDEMHEVVAYFGLGLLAFYLAGLLITSLALIRS